MPPIFGDLEYGRPENTYAGIPINEIKALNESQSIMYDKVRQSKDTLDVLYNNLDVEDRNFSIKKRAIDGLKNQFESLVMDGDYQNATNTVAQAVKGFQMDNELQGALLSRQKQLQYNKDLRDRLASGNINNNIYRYALERSNSTNDKQITYNPDTGQYENIYSGYNVTDDKSKEIYDNMYKRIENWKEGSILDANGNQYRKSAGSPTGYFNVTTGKEVTYNEVQNSLRKELEGSGQYRDFLKQEQEIDLYNRLKTPTGFRTLNHDDLTELGYTDDSIKTTLSGISQEQLDALSKSKKPSDIKKYKEYKNLRDSVDTSNLSQDQVDSLYTRGYRSKQIDKYVSPAAEKASFRLYDNEYLADNFGLENLKFQHDLAKASLEESDGVYAPPTNLSATENYTYKMYQDSQKKLSDVTISLNSNKLKLEQVKSGKLKLPPEQVTQLERDIKQQEMEKGILQEGSLQFKQKIRDTVDPKEYTDQALTDIFPPIASGTANPRNTQNQIAFLESIMNLPYNQSTVKAKVIAQQGLDNIKKGEIPLSQDQRTELNNQLHQVPESKQLLTQKADSMIDDVAYTDFNIFMNSAEESYFENQANTSVSTNIIANDSTNEKGDNLTLSQQQTNYWQDLVRSGSGFSTFAGDDLVKIQGGSTSSGDKPLYNAIGKQINTPALGDLTKASVRMTTKAIDGKFYLQVALTDKTGHQLYEKDNNGALVPAYKLVAPNDQEQYKSSLRNVGNEWITSSDVETQKKGYELLGQVNFAEQLATIHPEYLQNSVPITIYSNKSPNGIVAKAAKVNDIPDPNRPGQFISVFTLQNPDGTPFFQDASGNPVGQQNFASVEDLATYMQLTLNQ